jgi:phage gp36-like protein
MFISVKDLNYSMYPEVMDAISRNDYNYIDYAIEKTCSIIEAHLCNYYDVNDLFNKPIEERNPMLVDIACNIARYIIADVLNDMPVSIASGYERSMKELEKLMAGKTTIPGAKPAKNENGEIINFVKSGYIPRTY